MNSRLAEPALGFSKGHAKAPCPRLSLGKKAVLFFLTTSALGGFLTPGLSWGQTSTYGYSSFFPLMFLGPGPRAAVMGEGFAAVSDDVSALYYDPAGLAQVRSPEISAVHTNYYSTGFSEGLDYIHPLPDSGTFGLGLQYLSYGTSLRPSALEDFGVSAAFGAPLLDGVSFGLRGQWIREGRGTEILQTLSGDFSLLARPLDGLRFGLSLKNLGIETNSAPLPLELLSGVSWTWGQRKGEVHALTACLGEGWVFPVQWGSLAFPSELEWSLGLEYSHSKRLFLRAGYAWNSQRTGPDFPEGLSFGAGALLERVQLDGSFSYLGNQGNVYKLSLTFLFPGEPAEVEKGGVPPGGGAVSAGSTSPEADKPVVMKFEVTETSGLTAAQLFEQGLEKEKLGLPDEAIDFYLKAVDKDPHFEKSWESLGRLFLDKSMKSYGKALDLNPKDKKLRDWLERLKR